MQEGMSPTLGCPLVFIFIPWIILCLVRALLDFIIVATVFSRTPVMLYMLHKVWAVVCIPHVLLYRRVALCVTAGGGIIDRCALRAKVDRYCRIC